MTKIALVAFGILATTIGITLAEKAEIGHPAPEFNLQDTKGATHNLKHYKGKFVVLEWYNPDCPFVCKHYSSHNMQKLQKEYTQKGVVWLAIDSSAPGQQGNHPAKELNETAQKVDAKWTALLIDSDGKVGHLYGATTTPHMFIINKEGKIVYKGAIDDKPTAEIADIETAKNLVRAALDEAMADKEVTTSSWKSYGCNVKYASGN